MTVNADGYVVRRIGGVLKYEHRLAWEAAHGPIPDGHHVHHRNEDRADNRLENLELKLGIEHNREHTTDRHRSRQLDNRGMHSGRWRHDLDGAEIVRRRESGETFRSIAESLGAAHNTIATHYRRAKEVMAS